MRRAVRATGFAAITAGMVTSFLAEASVRGVRDEARSRLRDRWIRRWADALLALFAIRVDVRGETHGNTSRGRLVIANHRSTIDVAVLLRTFGGRMVSRGDLAEWPVLGPAARAVGTIFVDRASSASGAATMREVRTALKAGGTVCVFPEGTTFDGDEVRAFHAGVFVAALKTGAEIVPVGLAYQRGSGAAFVDEPFLAHLTRMAGAEPSRVVARVGAPIPIGDHARAAHLRDATHEAVRALVVEARRIVDG
jgi:1-acyl-sn-glycerol-3-phosphate acyltransferase